MRPLPTLHGTFIHIQNSEWHLEALSDLLPLLAVAHGHSGFDHPLPHAAVDFGPAPFDVDTHDVGHVGVDFGVYER
jgi:hypothetical protein